MMNYEVGRRVLRDFLGTIEDISSKEYQRRAWILGIPPGTSFDETIFHFFDMGDSVLEDYKICKVTESQYQMLKNFSDKFRNFSDHNEWPPYFIDTPEWTQITEEAKEVLKAFNYQPPSNAPVTLATTLRNIEKLSDKTYQERVWVKREGLKYEDIEEALFDYFDEGDWILERYEGYECSQEQYELLLNLNKKTRNFVDVFEVFTLEKSTEKLIHLPEWDEIVEMAKEVLKAFDYKKESSTETPPKLTGNESVPPA